MKVKKKSQKQEEDIAQKVGGNRVVASGALWGAKGDVRTDTLLIEAKTTSKEYYSVTAKVWEKIEREAVSDGLRFPLMIVDLKDGEKRYAVFSLNDFKVNTIKCFCDMSSEDRKSYRLNMNTAGYSIFGGYNHGIIFNVCGKKENVLCCMMFEDFSREKSEVFR